MAGQTEHSRSYQENGYVLVPELLTAREVAALRVEAATICRGKRGAVRGLQRDDPAASDDAIMARYLCIHFPHKISTVMRAALAQPKVVAVLAELIGPNVKCMQSMLFIKHAGKPGQAWHQDEYFIPTRDRSLTAAWIALDDATVENGCLWVVPGSHRDGVLWPRRAHGSDEFDEGDETWGSPYDGENGIPLEVAAGGVVFFHGYLLHRSYRNRARSGFRRALVNHYMSAESLLPWDWDGRLEPTRDNRDIVLVCGQDPYAYRGIADFTFPFLRGESVDDPNRDPSKKVF